MIESLEAQGLQLAKEKQEYLGKKVLFPKAVTPKTAILLFWIDSVVKPLVFTIAFYCLLLLDEVFE